MRAERVNLAAMCLTAGYYALIEYTDIYPWNDIRNGSGQERIDPAVLALQGMLIVGTARGARWARPANLVAYGGWFGLQVSSWWVPYLRGPSEELQQRYDRYFSSTVRFLPRIRRRPWVPDAAHIVLQGLIAASLVTSARLREPVPFRG